MTSSVGRELHRYRKGHGFKSRTGLNFFPLLRSNVSILRSRMLLSYIHVNYSSLHGFIWNQHDDQFPIVSLIGRALHRYRRGHEF